MNLSNPNAEPQKKDTEAAAAAFGPAKSTFFKASSEDDLETAFATLRADALLVSADPFFISQRDRLIALAARYSVPTSLIMNANSLQPAAS